MATRSQLSGIFYPDWEPEYRAALVETDPEKLAERIRLAAMALFNRSQNMGSGSCPEQDAICEATIALRSLIAHKLRHPHIT
jgi:hypothetical protein